MTETEVQDDDALVRSCLAGNSRAFVDLVRRHDKATRGTVFATLGPGGPIEDALQEGLLKAYKNLGSFTAGSSFRAWLCRIVHNAAIDEVRRANRPVPIGEQSVPNFDSTVIHELDLHKALQALPDKQRVAVMLVDVEGFDYPAAAQIVGVPTGTIASRVSAGRAALRLAFASTTEDGLR